MGKTLASNFKVHKTQYTVLPIKDETAKTTLKLLEYDDLKIN